nr:TonB-dependent receptor [Parahaliea mediterranea]
MVLAEPGALEEVVVTAQRREQSLQDVPISITAFGAAQIEKQNLQSATDYLQATPNVSYTEVGGQGPKGLNISIRGISDLQNAERVSATSAFSVYVDEFSVGTAARGTPNPQLYDIERLEILRGPQGTYFGRNSTGGAINITTKKPSDELFARVDLGIGNFQTHQIGGVLNVPITENFFTRLTVEQATSDGPVENVGPGGGESSYDNDNVRLAFHWDISQHWEADFSATRIREDSDLPPRVSVGIESRFGPNSQLDDERITCGLSFNTDDKACRDTAGFTDLEDDVLNLRLRYTGDEFGFVSITGRSTSELDQLNDLDGGGTPLVDRENDYSAESVSQELRLFSTDSEVLEWTIGGLVYKDELTANNRIIIRDFLGPWMAGDYANENTIDLEREGWALFGDINWHISDALTLTIGGRYSSDEEEQVWSNVFAACANRAEGDALADGCTLRPDQMTPLPVIDGRISGGRTAQIEGTRAGNDSTDFSPRLALNWDVNEDWTVYGVWSQGYKSAGARANPDSGGANSSVYDKEKLTNMELGVKAELNGGRTRLSAAIFSMDWDDFQTTTRETFCREADGSLRPQDGNENCEFVPLDRIQNAPSAKSDGFELSVDTLLGESWRAGLGYGYLDAEYVDFENAVLNGGNVDLSGYPLPNAPENTASAYLEYQYTIGAVDGYIRVDTNYRDSVFNQASIVDETRGEYPYTADSYYIVNLYAGLEWDRQRLALVVNNLNEDDDFVSGAGAGTAGIHVRVHPTTYLLKWTFMTN